jgi:hypothetical protein
MMGQECRRGTDCAERTPVYNSAGERTGWTPAMAFAPLCGGCRRTLAASLQELPAAVEAVSLEQIPTLEIVYRTDDCNGGGNIHPPIPINTHFDAVTRLVDHELSAWAEFVAEYIRLPWSSKWAEMSRSGDRISKACTLLALHLDDFLAIGDREYRARSLGENPWSGHDPRTTRRDASDWWCVLDGPAAGIRLIDLHRACQEITGAIATTRLKTLCRHCKRRTLNRDYTRNLITCSNCNDSMSDRAYEQHERSLVDGLIAS